MGIKGLSKIIETNCSNAIQNRDFQSYGTSRRKIAISAYVFLNKFLHSPDGDAAKTLNLLFYHAVGIIESGIQPVYVFHGNQYVNKTVRRKTVERQCQSDANEEFGNHQNNPKKVDSVLVQSAMKLLKLMGIPIVQAPGKAEAQCAALTKSGQVFAVATEDTEVLLYGAEVMIRDFKISNSKNKSMREFNLGKVLEGLQFSMDEFIDLCILIGCDYCPKIPRIGEKKALELIRKHKSIGEILNQIGEKKFKYNVPNEYDYQHAQQVYRSPTVDDTVEINWYNPIDDKGIISYLCSEWGLDKGTIQEGVRRLKYAQNKFHDKLDSFLPKRESAENNGTDADTAPVKKPRIEDKMEGQDSSGVSR